MSNIIRFPFELKSRIILLLLCHQILSNCLISQLSLFSSHGKQNLTPVTQCCESAAASQSSHVQLMVVSIIDKNRKNNSGVSVEVIISNCACTQFNTDNADYHKTKTHGKKQTNKQTTHTPGSKNWREKSICCRGREEKTSFISFSPLVVLAGCLSPFLRFSTSSQNTPSTSRNKLFAHAWVQWNSLDRDKSFLSVFLSLTERPMRHLKRHKGCWQTQLIWVGEKSDHITSTLNFISVGGSIYRYSLSRAGQLHQTQV